MQVDSVFYYIHIEKYVCYLSEHFYLLDVVFETFAALECYVVSKIHKHQATTTVMDQRCDDDSHWTTSGGER